MDIETPGVAQKWSPVHSEASDDAIDLETMNVLDLIENVRRAVYRDSCDGVSLEIIRMIFCKISSIY